MKKKKVLLTIRYALLALLFIILLLVLFFILNYRIVGPVYGGDSWGSGPEACRVIINRWTHKYRGTASFSCSAVDCEGRKEKID